VGEDGQKLAVLDAIDQLNGLPEVAGFDGHDHVDGIEVFLTPEAAGEVGFWVCGGLELRAQGTQKAEVAVRDFAGDAQKVRDKPGDGDLVSKHPEFFLGIAL
jgi:hypothetical protein